MVFEMKTTLNIDDTVMAELKREAARQKTATASRSAEI
jgi:copper(I)-binding protein